ncbi:hypothetical protein [Desulfitobacterium sp.]|uniref:hypothetical protein n=1 Tax=Desulfitobacterium sp. TaxID=49981 RepID=UPI002C3C0D12|nr:hypothetical protein [Desulfitobacterium sp.]HVJ49737.1 hypothetical protein [Desulfitobacterium sp.]
MVRSFFGRSDLFAFNWNISAILGGIEGKVWKVLLEANYLGISRTPLTIRGSWGERHL